MSIEDTVISIDGSGNVATQVVLSNEHNVLDASADAGEHGRKAPQDAFARQALRSLGKTPHAAPDKVQELTDESFEREAPTYSKSKVLGPYIRYVNRLRKRLNMQASISTEQKKLIKRLRGEKAELRESLDRLMSPEYLATMRMNIEEEILREKE